MDLIKPIGEFVNTISGNKASQEFSANEAKKQREWEEKMSNTAYQRAIEDMKKAGLNPAAMYGGGSIKEASTPSGAAASSSGGGQFGNVLNGIANIINSAGNMTSTMNSKSELNKKAQIYTSAEKLMRQAYHLSKFK